MTYTSHPEDYPPSKRERIEITDFLRSLRLVRSTSGFGDLCIVVRDGEIVEIKTTYTTKPSKIPAEVL
jgi:hypothetical protein